MALEVTEEMRQAVYAADCDALGHIPDVSPAIMSEPATGPDGSARITVGNSDATLLPHLRCRRCGHVWLVIEDPGTSYDDAVAKEKARVKDPDSVKPNPRKDPQPVKEPKHP